nr:ABC transporter permease [Paenibacillus sp. NEAU-GSW1]
MAFAFRNVLRNKRIYAAYFASSAFSVMIFFVCALFTSHPSIQGGSMAESAVKAMVAAEWIMFVFAFLFVLYSVQSILNSRSKEFGLYRLSGMTTNQLGKIVFWENMLIGAAAIVLGIASGLVSGKLFLMICSVFLGISELVFEVPWKSLVWTVGAFAALFAAISWITAALLRRSKLVDLFHAGLRPKENRRANVWLAGAAAILLALSYVLAATSEVTTIYNRMLPVAAMTVAGTYLLYTQLIGFIVQSLRRWKAFYWQKTNVVTIASLAHRFRGNARMFFMVTILSTVSFCSVGVFASVNTLMRSFQEDYPAAIAYVAKQGSLVEQQHLHVIEQQLAERRIVYKSSTMLIKKAQARVLTSRGQLSKMMPIVSYSDYRNAIELAGRSFTEAPLSGGDALVILTSQRERSYIAVRKKATYSFIGQEGEPVTVREIGYTEHVPIPDYLSAIVDIEQNDDFGGVVVSDSLFAQIADPISVDRYTGFYTANFMDTAGLAKELAKNGLVRYDESSSYAMTVSGTLYEVQKSLYNMMLLVSLLIGAVFFIAAGSFLYFRLYSDLEYDRRQYAAIAHIGLTDKELKAIVTRQLAIWFFVPIGVAVIHAIFAFSALQTMFYLSVAAELGIVLASFVAAQIAYFYFIRQRYLRNLKKRMR